MSHSTGQTATCFSRFWRPVTLLKFLGIIIDTNLMEYHLASDKLEDLRKTVAEVVRYSKVQLRELHSLSGKLNFA